MPEMAELKGVIDMFFKYVLFAIIIAVPAFMAVSAGIAALTDKKEA